MRYAFSTVADCSGSMAAMSGSHTKITRQSSANHPIETPLPVVERKFRHPGRKSLADRRVLCWILLVLYTGIRCEFSHRNSRHELPMAASTLRLCFP